MTGLEPATSGVKLGMLARDPFAVRRPSDWSTAGSLEPEDRPRHLSLDQARVLDRQAMREAQAGSWTAWRTWVLIRICLCTGMRASEALALRWADVDLNLRFVSIRPHARRPLKTRASRRRVPIPPPLAECLEAWLPECGSAEWVLPGSRRSGPWLGGSPGAILALRPRLPRWGSGSVTGKR